MKAYVDSSVVLRLVLGQPGKLGSWKAIKTAVSSALTEVECLRTLDRLRLRFDVGDEALAVRREAVYRLLDAFEIVELTRPVLARASQPFSTTLGSLDALHLATALLYRETTGAAVTMATHDEALALAARSSGLAVVGVAD